MLIFRRTYLYLYSIWFLISSLFLGDRSVHRLREDLCTERSPKKSEEIRNQMLYRYN